MKTIKNSILCTLILFSWINIKAVNPPDKTEKQKKSTYAVNTETSKINWKGEKPTGEHVGFIKLKSGNVNVENGKIIAGTFIIEMNSIVCNDIENESMNKRLVDHLKSSDFFDVEKYPQGTFTITSVSSYEGQENANSKVTGDLTLKGITHEISFLSMINFEGNNLSATTPKFVIDRAKWNVRHKSKSFFSDLQDSFIYDDITLSIELDADKNQL